MKKIVYYFISGMAVAITYIMVAFFFQSPPTRAEFDALKVEVKTDRYYIRKTLAEIKEDIKFIRKNMYDIF